MNRIFSILAALVLATQISTADNKPTLKGAKVGEWTMDLAAAAKLAQEKGLPILANFTGSDWCHWCIHMDKEVFSKSEWREFAAKNVIPVTIDFPRDKSGVPAAFQKRNDALAKKHGVRGYPTFVVLDVDGKTELGRLGASKDVTPASFIRDYRALAKFNGAFVAALEKQDPAKAKAMKTALAKHKAAKQRLDQWLATRPRNTAENREKLQVHLKEIGGLKAALEKF